MNRRAWLLLVAVSLLPLGAAGCGGQPEETPEVAVAPPAAVVNDFLDEISLANMLTRPRTEIARQADAVQEKVNFLEEKILLGQQRLGRAPDLRLPVATPVFREAKYSKSFGFSVPPYLPEGAEDSGLALHLARFGDVEAARELVEPGDDDARRRIDALAGPKNYPVEWTRLVALLLHNAQLHLAAEEQLRPVRLIALHNQVAQALDRKAQAGPLGAALLPRGHFLLKNLARGWRERDVTELADPAEAGLKGWGPFPAPALPFQVGKTSRAEVARLLGVPDVAGARVLEPASLPRALDVLALPLHGTPEAETLVCSFDDGGTLRDLTVIYRGRLNERIPRPAQLGQLLEEATPADRIQATQSGGLGYRTYTLDGAVVDVAVIPHNFAAGGVVRFHDGQAAGAAALPRGLGAVSLDRSFEQNRRRVALHQLDSPLVLDDDELAQAGNPVTGLKLLRAELHRAGTFDVTGRLTLQWTAEQKGQRTLGKFARPLWALAGAPHLAAVGGPHDGHLALTWQDARTRWTLHLPNKADAAPSLEVVDRTPPGQLQGYAAQVRARELAERAKRVAAGQPQQRLERAAAGVSLGSARAAVAAKFPEDNRTAVLARTDTLALRFARPPADGLLWQEVVARFDANQKAVEVRFRFRDAPGKGGAVARQLEALRAKYGAPETLPAPWTAAWPNKGKAVLLRWQDDTTVVTWQQDGGGVELAVRDCPAAHVDGVPLPPLALLDRGPAGCQLGDARSAVLARNKGQQPAQAGAPWQLTPAKAGPYDVLLVWFDEDRVVRVVGRHAVAAAKVNGPEAAKLVADSWNQQFSRYGWPRRQEVNGERVLESQGNHDDRTRVRIFWRKEQGGGSLFTEWTELAP